MVDKPTQQIPRYREVYEQLRKHIEKGIYAPGDLLPSENELCAVNQVTRPTVRRALDILANEGYISKHQGLGSVVQNTPKGIGILSFSGTTSAIGRENLKTDVIVKPNVRPWPEEFVFDLSELERESGCIYFERIRYVNDAPVFYDLSFLPNINLPRFTARNLNNLSLFELLRDNYRIEIKGGMQYIEAIPATDSCQQHLAVSSDRPILKLQRKLITNRQEFFVYSILFCNTEEHSLFGEF
jgi:GntR family transcriptional regulator/GntR family frlABCD operon transcriptional regulator